MRRKILSIFVCIILSCQAFCFPAFAKPDWPSDTGIQGEGGIVVDADTGAVIFGQNIHQPYHPASITKILTALVVLENCKLDETVEFSSDAFINMEDGVSNPIDIAPGDKLSVEDCLYALLLRSCNQVANALAEHVAGSREAFVDMMNQRIAQLGCTKSHFKNPSGLNDEEQVVTPYEMAKIARAAYENPTLLEIGSALSHRIGVTSNNPDGRKVSMEHKMLITTDKSSAYYYPHAVAGKTGFTSIAYNTLVTYAKKDGRRQISVVLMSNNTHYSDTKAMLDFGFDRFKNVNIAENEKAYVTGEEPVAVGGLSYSPGELEIEPAAAITLPNQAEFADSERALTTELPAGCPENAVALIKYTYNERDIGRAYLLLKEEAVAANQPAGDGRPDRIPATGSNEGGGSKGGEPSGLVQKGVVALVVLLAVGCAGGGYLWYQKKKEERDLAMRRARRRERLREVGCSEEEFERLLKERMGSGRGRDA